MTSDERLALSALGAIIAITVTWWSLALWPVQAAPEWLSRTRSVCFGAVAGGLPDGGGWILLVGQPLSMLGFLLIVWGGTVRRALAAGLSRPFGRRLIGAIAIVLLAGFMGAAARVASVVAEAPGDAPATPVTGARRLDREAPPLRLVDQRGRPFELSELRGTPVLLTFAYAHCETICPTIVHEALTARDRAAVAGAAVVVVTIDPWRDTAARLPSIAFRWGLGTVDRVLSGDIGEVLSALEAWNVRITRDAATGLIDHPAIVYVIDRGGRIAFATSGGIDAMVELLRRS